MPQNIQGEITKDLIKGTVFVVGLFFICGIFPLMSLILPLFIPLPVLFYRLKLGRNIGAIIPSAATLIVFAVSGRFDVDLVFFSELLLMGFMIGDCFEKNYPVELTVLKTCAAIWAAGIAVIVFYINVMDIDILLVVSGYVEEVLKMTVTIYERAGASQDMIHEAMSSMEQKRDMMVAMIPSFVISFTLILVWITLLVAKPVLKIGNMPYPAYGPLCFWKAPEFLVWAVIACGIMLFLPHRAINLVGVNGIIVLMTVYFFAGIAIVAWFFEQKRLPPMIRIMLYSIIAIQQWMLLLIAGLGFFDIWLNLRKMNSEE